MRISRPSPHTYINQTGIRLVLAFVGGFCTTATYLRSHVLGAMMTVNMILFATSMFQRSELIDGLRLLLIPLFIITVVASTVIYKAQRRRLLKTATSLHVLAACLAIGGSIYQHHFNPEHLDWLITALMVMALAIQHTITAYTGTPLTTAITSLSLNLLILSSEKYLLGKKANIDLPSSTALLILAGSLVCFIAGAITATILTLRFGYCSLMVPATLMLIIVGLSRPKVRTKTKIAAKTRYRTI